MFKKTSIRMMVGCVVLVIPIVFGSALTAYAREASMEPPENMVLKGGKIVGVLSGVWDSGNLTGIRIVGSFYMPSGTKPVALNIIGSLPLGVAGATKDDILAATEEGLENWALAGMGPPGFFSESGGEMLIITRVSEVFVAESVNSGVILGAIITIRAIAPTP